MSIYQIGQDRPKFLGNNIFIADNASLIGKVIVGNHVSIWYGAVIRGDIETVTMGDATNIQDNVVVHVDHGVGVNIGNGVTIGHSAIIHACEIADNCLIGMGATILTGAKIGKNSVVGANALVTQNMIIPENSLVVGLPARVIRSTTPEEIERIKASAKHYKELVELYRNMEKL